MKDFRKALQDFDAAVRIGGFTNSRYARGWAKLQLGDTAEGNMDMAEAKRANPKVEVVFDQYYGIKK